MNQSEVCDDIDNNCDWNGLEWARYIVYANVMKEGHVVAMHVPFNLSPTISLFLRRDVNKAK